MNDLMFGLGFLLVYFWLVFCVLAAPDPTRGRPEKPGRLSAEPIGPNWRLVERS